MLTTLTLKNLANWVASLEPPRELRHLFRRPSGEATDPDETDDPTLAATLDLDVDEHGETHVTPGTVYRIVLGRGRDATEFLDANAEKLWRELVHELGNVNSMGHRQWKEIERIAAEIRASTSTYRHTVDAAFTTRRIGGKTVADLIRAEKFREAANAVAHILDRGDPEDKQ